MSIGLGIGKWVLANSHINWNLPQGITDVPDFVAVGTMHTCSYIGGLIGLLFGMVYMIKKRNENLPTSLPSPQRPKPIS